MAAQTGRSAPWNFPSDLKNPPVIHLASISAFFHQAVSC
jgi:hypothetical protein